ncbi:hypothetical protein [Nocardioides sp.]|uniref:hypothetical protein n=1 Tax=Nocardioides sp. TaxID=35761 RepID=UPI00286A9734|nr:hypothetical protein [Nocardioides sp.]
MSSRPGWRFLLATASCAVVLIASAVVPAPAAAPAGAPSASPVVGLRAGAPPTASERRSTVRMRAVLDRPGERRVRSLLTSHLRQAPPGAVVRGVVWTYSSAVMTTALLDAARRGVRVRVLVGGISCAEPAFLALAAGLPDASWARCVRGSARSGDSFDGLEANLHQKSWTFSRAGSERWISIVTTANATDVAETDQYNDAVELIGHHRLYQALGRVFEQQARDRSVRRPYRHVELGGGVAATFLPWTSPTQRDPVVERIRSLPGPGTVIRVAQSNWQDPRGVRIAHALVDRRRAGADVAAVVSSPFGPRVSAVLREGGVRVESAWFGPHRYSHLKFLAASYDGARGRVQRVWTGSENWWSPSRGHDELVVRVDGRSAYVTYAGFFGQLWREARTARLRSAR